MGIMSAGSDDVFDGADDAGPVADAPEPKESTPAAEAPAPEPTRVPAPKPSRREAFSKSQEELKQKIEELGQRASQVDELNKSVSEYKERLAKYEGAIEEMRRQQQEFRTQKTPTKESHEEQIQELEQKAIAALVDQKDWAAYQRIQRQISGVIAEKLYQDRVASQPQAQQINPAVIALEMEFKDVVAHPAGRQAAIAFDQFLAAKGKQDGPARWREAYEMAARELGYAKPTPATDKSKEKQLTGVSAGKNGSGKSSGRHVRLTQAQLEIAKKSGLGAEEYARLWAEDHPEDVEES